MSVFLQKSDQYSKDVLGGKIPACDWVGLSCERYERDKKDSRFEIWEEKANAICNFIQLLPHVKGKWARPRNLDERLIVLEPWQIFCLVNIFGFYEKDSGLRRFRRALIMVPRKNSKSTMAAGIGLYMLAPDGEPGAEVFSGASTEKQALEVFSPARVMALQREDLQKFYGIYVGAKNLSVSRTNSRFEPIIGNPGDGASPHCAILDEVHEHKTSDQLSTMETGMGARDEPLLLMISTAGIDMSGPCYEEVLNLRSILKQEVEREDYFGIEYGINPEDPWDSMDSLKKANPNFGVSVSPRFLQSQLDAAKGSARKQGPFKVKHLNQWTGTLSAYFDVLKWMSLKKSREEVLKPGMKCFVGLDLASRVDLAALQVIFSFPNDYWYTFGNYYMPMETARASGRESHLAWGKEGYITLTEGNMIDFEKILQDIVAINQVFPIVQIAADPYQSTMLAGKLVEKDFDVVLYGQTVKNFSYPMKTVDSAILAEKMGHDENPCMEWMMGNVMAKPDLKQNVFPRKERDENLIDGPVALIMAMGIALQQEAERLNHPPERSVYEDRGLLSFG